MTWTVTVEPKPGAAIRRAIARPLAAYNTAAAGPGNWAPFAVTVRDRSGKIAGGLWGSVWHGMLNVELLAMGKARGNGIGRKVMQAAEEEARRRSCTAICVDTLTWQAPGFYPKFGFVEFGRIPNYTGDHDRIYFIKRLAPTGTAAA